MFTEIFLAIFLRVRVWFEKRVFFFCCLGDLRIKVFGFICLCFFYLVELFFRVWLLLRFVVWVGGGVFSREK